MERAVISIGVRRTGDLPELKAAIDTATQVAGWASAQEIPKARVKLITDAKRPVSRDQIFQAVQKVTALGFVEQLIVYFSGHGINSGLFEQWLLSGAPEDPGAAVNLKSSEFAARFCGIGHVIFISDACRTAAASIQAQQVVGNGIFPAAKPSGPEKPVDQFFATLVGDPAYEVQSVKESAGRYLAAYSSVLLDALAGKAPSILEAAPDVALIRPRPLKRHLANAVPAFFAARKLPVSAQPDARIESDPDAWLAQVPLTLLPDAPAAREPKRRTVTRRSSSRATGEEDLPPVGAGSMLTTVPTLTFGLQDAVDPGLRTALKYRGRGSFGFVNDPRADEAFQRFGSRIALGRTTFGPDHLETQCGIKVRGTRIEDVYSRYADAHVGTAADIVQVDLPRDRQGANVLLRVADGSAVVVPAFRDFLTGLSFNQSGALEDVWCEPSVNSVRSPEFQRSAGEIRQLRAFIAAATALGVFRLDDEREGMALLDRLRSVKALDPALAVYAAYAFHDRRMRSQIRDMQRYLDRDLHARIFDVALLAFSIGQAEADAPVEMYPCVPMLTQGWALLAPLDIELPGNLDTLRGELRPSLWTHFTARAFDRLLDVLKKGRVG